MRALRPAALPSDTSVRFVLVMAAVTTASLYLFQALWFAGRTGFLQVIRACGLVPDAGSSPITLGGVTAELAADQECRAGISREQGLVAVAGATLVLVVAWSLYRAVPTLRERRRHLAEPDPVDAQALIASVDHLAAQAGIQPTPAVRLDVADAAISGVAYGAGSRLRLGLSGGLVVAQITEPGTYEAVVRHELGHVANRDVRWTYYSVATWWSFVAVALVPVVLTFLVRDPQYVLRLGWRTAVLAGLVATTLAALLRTRELYADARAADWGSAAALDRVLAQRSSGPQETAAQRAPVPTRSRPRLRPRPAALRLHPEPQRRRGLLADPDGLFSGSGWLALAAAIACGTASASIGDIAYLLVPQASIAVSTLVVAPLLAIALCVPAWRVALRAVVRGAGPSISLQLGVGAGVGLAVAPMLTMAAAMGGTASSAAGWLGYLLWSLGMVLLGLTVAWWTCGTARLCVTASLSSARGPGRALTVHVVVASAVIALWLAASAQLRTVLTINGVSSLAIVTPWDLVDSAFGVPLPYLPLLMAALLLALPLWAHARLRRAGAVQDPAAGSWLWRDHQPTEPRDLPGAPEAARTRPPFLGVLGVGVGAGVVAGLAALGVLIAGELLGEDARTSDAFALALGSTVGWAILVAGVVTGAVAAGVLPRLWWPLGLASSLAAMAIAAAGGWVLLTATLYGLFKHSDLPAHPLGLTGSLLILVRPAAQAVLPCMLVIALVGALRGWLTGARRIPVPGAPGVAVGTGGPLPDTQFGPEPGERPAPQGLVPADEAPSGAARAGAVAPAQPPGTPRWGRRVLVGGMAAALACGLLIAPRIAGILTLQPNELDTAWASVEVPATWTGAVDPESGLIVLNTLDGEVRVALTPIPAPAPPTGTAALVVDGVELPQVAELDQGVEHWWVYEGQTPAGGQRVIVIGQPASVSAHAEEIRGLLAEVQWKSASGDLE